MPQTSRYFRPQTLDQALSVLEAFRPSLLAGGTDLYPSRVDRKVMEPVLDLSGLPELAKISRLRVGGKEVLRLGALVTWTEVLAHPDFAMPGLVALAQCAREVGGPQIQNRGTVVGNLCNASPAADGVPCLMALGAHLELSHAKGARLVTLNEFLLGPRRTALEPGEMVTAVLLPRPAASMRSVFLKMGSRRYLVISIAMLAAQWNLKAKHCVIAVGACSAVAQRLAPLEQWFLNGAKGASRDVAVQESLKCLTPIDDVRADRAYRLALVETLCEKLALEVRGG